MWHERARHCPICAAPLVEGTVESRRRRRCAECDFVLYQNPAAAAAGVVLNRRREVLLVRRAIEPFKGAWALPAGYQEVDEEPRAALAREVREETGVEVDVLGLLDLLFVEDPRKPANVAVYLCTGEGDELRPGADVDDASWFALDRLPAEIGFDNYQLVLRRLVDRKGWPRSAWSSLEDLLGR